MSGPDTRTQLLVAAEDAARRRGHDGFSYADLSAAVGIRKASVHHHFPSKAQLLSALMARYTDAVAARLAEIEDTSPSAADRIIHFAQMYRDALSDGDQLCLCVSLTAGRDGLPPMALAAMAEFRAMVTAWLRRAFQDAKQDGSIAAIHDPGAEAAAILALVEGAQIAARAAQDVTLFDQAVIPLLHRLMRA